MGGNTGGGGGEGDEGSIKLSSQIGSLFEIMTNVLKMTGIGNHKMVLDPISKLVIFIQSNSMGLFNCNFTYYTMRKFKCIGLFWIFYTFRSVMQFKIVVFP